MFIFFDKMVMNLVPADKLSGTLYYIMPFPESFTSNRALIIFSTVTCICIIFATSSMHVFISSYSAHSSLAGCSVKPNQIVLGSKPNQIVVGVYGLTHPTYHTESC